MSLTLRHILYLSRRLPSTSDAEVDAMVRRAQAFNSESGVTGLLVSGQHWFLQHIEGLGKDINSVFERISASPLHDHITTLSSGILLGREFSGWSMASFSSHKLDDVVAACGISADTDTLRLIDKNILIGVASSIRRIIQEHASRDGGPPVIFID